MRIIEIDGTIFNPGTVTTVTDNADHSCEVRFVDGTMIGFHRDAAEFMELVNIKLGH